MCSANFKSCSNILSHKLKFHTHKFFMSKSSYFPRFFAQRSIPGSSENGETRLSMTDSFTHVIDPPILRVEHTSDNLQYTWDGKSTENRGMEPAGLFKKTDMNGQLREHKRCRATRGEPVRSSG